MRPGDGERQENNPRDRVLRDGSFNGTAISARSAYRTYGTPEYRDVNLAPPPGASLTTLSTHGVRTPHP